jgi:hypothetical protein
LPNYSELSKSLTSELLGEIYNLSLKKKSGNILQLKASFRKNEKSLNIDQLYESTYIDNNGLYFGIFQSSMINELNNDISIEMRISTFQKFKKLYDENITNQDFIKHISAFYSFIVNYTKDKVNTIIVGSIQIVDSILSNIPGVSIITNIHHSLSALLVCLGNQNVQVRETTRLLFHKIMMIIPTSQLLPYLVKELKEFNWIKVNEIISLLSYMFKELRSIYNDIDFTDSNFDDLIIVEIIKLLQHNTPRVTEINIRLYLKPGNWFRL